MKLPILKQIILKGIHPFPSQTAPIIMNNNIMKFHKQNAKGKTTLIESIILNLFRGDQNYKLYKKIKEKRFSEEANSTMIEGKWIFTGNIEIIQKVNNNGIKSSINQLEMNHDVFNRKLCELFETDISKMEIKDIFNYLVYLDEDFDNVKIIENWKRFVETLLPHLCFSTEEMNQKMFYNLKIQNKQDLLNKVQEIQQKKIQINEFLEESIELDTEELDIINSEILNINQHIEEKNNEIEELNTRIREIGNEKNKILMYGAKLNKIEKLITEKRNMEIRINEMNDSFQVRQEISDIFSNQNAADVIKQEFNNNPMCRLCSEYNIKKHWEKNIRVHNQCPICKKNLKFVESATRSEIWSTIDESAPQQQEIEITQDIIQELSNKINEIEQEIITAQNQKQMLEEELEISEESINSDERFDEALGQLLDQMTELRIEKENLIYQKSSKEALIHSDNRRNHNERIMQLIDDQLNIFNTQINQINSEIENLEPEIENYENARETLTENLIHYIEIKSEELLGSRLIFDFSEKKLILPSGESRNVYHLSKSEKIFFELVVRIITSLFLLENKYQTQIQLILDYPDAIIDRQDLKNKVKEIINISSIEGLKFIITSGKNEIFPHNSQPINIVTSRGTLEYYL